MPSIRRTKRKPLRPRFGLLLLGNLRGEVRASSDAIGRCVVLRLAGPMLGNPEGRLTIAMSDYQARCLCLSLARATGWVDAVRQHQASMPAATKADA